MNVHNTLDPVAELKAMAATPFERARAIPTSAYTSEAMLAAELDRIFRREWICVGRVDQLARPGDYLTREIAGQPVLVLRDHAGGLRAMSNVCLHRMSTLMQGQGNATTIRCPYHGWTYGLDGRLRGAAGMGLNQGFRRGDYCLPPIRCEEWLGWIMVTLYPDAPPVAERLRPVEEMVADFGMAGYVQTFQETHRWNTNWKVLGENFMESYHLPVCHGPTIGGYVSLEEMDCPAGLPAFNWHTILKDPSFKLSVAHPDNRRLEGERRRTTYLLTIYPALFITLTPGYFWYLVLHPDGVGHVRILYGGGMSPDFAGDPEAETMFAETKALLDEVNAEDKECTERVYRGICSGLARPGHLSHLERPIYDFATYLASRVG
jgi:phenylpropionate dioxygenase-like ring-hydroxylating dioxygenase large terminal subunit